MNKQNRTSHLVYSRLALEADGFDSLAELALDLRWSWNHAADEVWQKLDPALWELTHNPWVVLQTVSRDQIEQVFADPFSVKPWMPSYKPNGKRQRRPPGSSKIIRRYN